MPALISKITAFATAARADFTRRRSLLAVSGGIDSVVLAEVFHRQAYRFGIAHCNFQLRGQESDGDEAFVRELAARLKVPVFVKRFETEAYAALNKLSVQVAARELRYRWFEELRAEENYHYVVTAHHLNDNIETVLYNFIKGTGIKGLRGMQVRQGRLVRPMLSVSRAEIQAFRQEAGLLYREDSSNLSDKYSRNKIRHQLLPLIEEINPGFEDSMTEKLKVFADLEALYDARIRRMHAQLFLRRKEAVYIPIRKLKATAGRRSVLFEFLRPYGFNAAQVDDILDCLDQEPGRQFLASESRIIKDRRFLILTKNIREELTCLVVQGDEQEINLPAARISLKRAAASNSSIRKSSNYACLDAGKLEFPLLLRHWRKGDYFYPFGMEMKKKKLSKYFKDQKIPIHEKETVWILESNKKLVWVVGHRIDERFRVRAGTKEVLTLKYTNTGA